MACRPRVFFSPSRSPGIPARPWRRLLLVLAFGLLGACGTQEDPALRFGLAAAPVTLDPRFATDAVSTRLTRLLYQSLVDFDANLRPVAGLAGWERLGPLHYRFTLVPGDHRFHDGTPLTARDVKATYDSILDPASASPHRGGLDMIEAITRVDDRTVDFHLSRPDALFPGRLVVGIVPAAAIAAGRSLQREPLGSGPFVFGAWPAEGDLRLLRRRDGAEVRFLKLADPTVRVLKLLRGELDVLQSDLPPELVAWLSARDELQVSHEKGTNFSYLGFNMEDPLTGQRELRRAVAHGVDRQAIISHVMGGAARPAGALLPPDHWAGRADLKGYDHDPEAARRLIERVAARVGSTPRITYKTSSSPFRVRLATVIQHQLKAVGLDVDVNSYDWGTFYGDVKAGRFQMYSLAWVGIKMPDIFRYVFHSDSVPPHGANRGRYSSPRADALMEAAEQAATQAEQARLYRELQHLLYVELPYVPLWYEDHVVVASKRLWGYHVPPDGNYDSLVEATW
ncbi:MAG: ABC transporter substrate-binding protein [Gammaproteobacteria bacterium]|nr:ABC transporter substrate-binding protein [Gammaproteobacteria bacterium]